MKKALIVGLIASLPLASFAQSKIDPIGVLSIERARIEAENEVSLLGAQRKAPAATSAFVSLAPGTTADDLAAQGYDVLTTIGRVAIVSLPILEVEALADLDMVEAITLERPITPLMNLAREDTRVDDVQNATIEGVTTAYRGANASVGLYDTGLDPNHVNFRDRVKALHVVDGTKLTSYTTRAQISKFKTETNDNTHGTHVAGIMAGSYTGDAEIAITNSQNKTEVTKGPVPYYGIAPEADIVIGCGTLTTTAIAMGVDAVVKTMRSLGKPGVINLSLGSNDGPHDGSDAFGQTLSELSKEVVICVSAGNEGQENISIEKKFTMIGTKLNTFVTPVAYSGSLPDAYTFSGQVEFWSNDATEFAFDLVLYDRFNGEAAYTYSVPNLEGKTVRINADTTPAFGRAFSGSGNYILVTSGINPNNNRYYVLLQASLSRNASSEKTINVACNLKGKSGQTVNGYTRMFSTTCSNSVGLEFNNLSTSGYTNGSPDNSLNDMSCGPNVICVGAYATRNRYPQLNGSSGSGWGMSVGSIAPFSSWGKTVDGRQLPLVCAPGTSVISSVNSYYTGKSYATCSAYLEEDTRSNYWMALSGTSMSSPFMAGVIALWLDANPELTTQQVIEIIKETSVTDSDTAKQPARWGAGKVDAAAGLCKAIQMIGVEGIHPDSDANLVISRDGALVNVFYGGAAAIDLDVFSISGAHVAHTRAAGDSAQFDSSALTSGVYLLAVTTDSGNRLTHKFVVK